MERPYYRACRFQYASDCEPTLHSTEEAISDRKEADFNVSCIGISFEGQRFGWYVLVYGQSLPSEELDTQLKNILSTGRKADIPEDFIEGFIEKYVLEDQKDKNLLTKPIHKPCTGKPFSQN